MNLDPTLSSGFYVDAPRDCVHQTRSQSVSVADYPFDSLTGWTNICGGTSSISIVASGNPDPAIGNVLDFVTGGTIGSTAGVQKISATIPESFGALVILELTAAATASDALHIYFQNSQGANVMLRFYNSAVEVFQDGAWRLLFAHGGAYYTEWWIEAAKQANGSYTVSVYAGTTCVGARNGYLPGGPSGNNNLVLIQQHSDGTSGRHSKIALVQIGATQLPDAMTLVSEAVEAITEPAKGRIRLLVENVSENLAPNLNLIARLSKDDGATWMQVPLFDRGLFGPGVIDPAKEVRILIGKTKLVGAGQDMRWRIEVTPGSFLPVRRVEFPWN
jgi:hypothetical protein